jgi:DNA-directed RNA polymerase specialized sigma24 family protein
MYPQLPQWPSGTRPLDWLATVARGVVIPKRSKATRRPPLIAAELAYGRC